MHNTVAHRFSKQVCGFLLASIVACIGFLGTPPALAQSTTLELNIPAQPMEATLRHLAEKHKVQVVFSPTVVRGVMAPELRGSYTIDQAMQRLTEGTQLSYSFNGRDTVVVKEKSEERRAAPTTSLPSDVHKAESIMVTATKREERLIDVPMSVAVVTKDEIDRRGLVSAADYLRGIPGVNQVDSAIGQSIVIRGIETSLLAQNALSGPTIATYFGETPTTTSAGLGGGTNVDLKLVDIERVEVLRGPQGTAFGNSSLGGAVRTIPVAPRLDRFEGRVGASYSATSGTGGDNYMGQAVINVPLVNDKAAIRAVAYQFKESGFYRNRAGSDAAFRAVAATPYGAEAFATNEENVGAYYAAGARAAALFQASDDLKFTLSYLSQKTESDGFALATSGTYEQTVLQIPLEHVVRGRKGGVFDTDIDLANAVMEYSLGWANLLATYSYIKSGTTASLPFTYAEFNFPWSSVGRSDHREYVGEIRLATKLDGAWNLLAGLYAEEVRDDSGQDNVWYGDPASNFIAPGVRSFGDRFEKRNLKQKAAFGEASWEFVPRLTLTGGVRTYKYDRTAQVDTTGPLYGNTHDLGNTTASGATGRANLSFKPDDGVLLYAGWSQGFRLGKPQAGLPSGVCDRDGDGIVDGTSIAIESTRKTNADNVDNYELGGKFALLDRRLTIAADVFRMDWSGMPLTVTVPSCNFLTYLANGRKAVSEGIELQTSFQITKPFRIDFGGSWIRARLTEDAPAANAFKGDRLPGSPQTTVNLSLQYEFVIGGYKAFARADSIYVGSFYGDLQQTANLKTNGYAKLDASTRVEIGSLNIELFVRNLTNEDSFTNRGAFNNVGPFYGYRLRPRTIGFQVGYVF
jgi:iron complex outermembrane recepter protein